MWERWDHNTHTTDWPASCLQRFLCTFFHVIRTHLGFVWTYCLECIWQLVFVFGSVTTESVLGNGMAEKWALVNVGGKNTFSYSSIIVHICEVVRQNHLSQVVWVYFSQGQESFIRGGKVLSSEMPLLPPFDQWSRFRSELHFLFQHSFNIGTLSLKKQTSPCGILPHDLMQFLTFFFFLRLQHLVGWSF